MEDDTFYMLFFALVIIIAGTLIILWMQMEFNTSVIVVRALFNITPTPTVSIATNISTVATAVVG